AGSRSRPPPAGPPGRSPRSRARGPRGGPRCSRPARLALESRDELVELELLQRAPDRRELPRALLDQRLALGDQRERLLQARLARVQPPDDLFDPSRGLLVGEPLGRRARVRACSRLGAHRFTARAGSSPSAKRSESSPDALAAAALVTGSPAGEETSA